MTFAIVALQNPKNSINVGSVLRAAGCFGAAGVVVGGTRTAYRHANTDTMAAHKRIPLTFAEDLHDAIPFDCVPIAVDLVDGAKSIATFPHPPRAFYVFGPEDGTLGRSQLSWCRDVVYVPTDGCLNLAAAVNVLLFARCMQRGEWPVDAVGRLSSKKGGAS